MTQDRTPEGSTGKPQEPAPDKPHGDENKTNTNGGEQSKSGSGLSTGVETGAIQPGKTQGANNAR
ncbi:MAG: hypothetical protein KAX56_06750 [Phenylobacterium sp.]|nr:hypothetical protein [Phenylobacterium sp.]